MGLLSPRTILTFIRLNFQLVRTTNLSHCSPLPLPSDSSFYYTCAQGKNTQFISRDGATENHLNLDFKLHIFDMTAPRVDPPQASSSLLHPGLKSSMAVKNVIQGHPGRWTVTDANLSPDNERYSDILISYQLPVISFLASPGWYIPRLWAYRLESELFSLRYNRLQQFIWLTRPLQNLQPKYLYHLQILPLVEDITSEMERVLGSGAVDFLLTVMRLLLGEVGKSLVSSLTL